MQGVPEVEILHQPPKLRADHISFSIPVSPLAEHWLRYLTWGAEGLRQNGKVPLDRNSWEGRYFIDRLCAGSRLDRKPISHNKRQKRITVLVAFKDLGERKIQLIPADLIRDFNHELELQALAQLTAYIRGYRALARDAGEQELENIIRDAHTSFLVEYNMDAEVLNYQRVKKMLQRIETGESRIRL